MNFALQLTRRFLSVTDAKFSIDRIIISKGVFSPLLNTKKIARTQATTVDS